MTKAAILQCIEEMEHKLMELRAAVERLPEAAGEGSGDPLADFEREEPLDEANDLQEVFATLRAAWNIPHDVQPALPLMEIQERMAEGLPENWASREVMRMREE